MNTVLSTDNLARFVRQWTTTDRRVDQTFYLIESREDHAALRGYPPDYRARLTEILEPGDRLVAIISVLATNRSISLQLSQRSPVFVNGKWQYSHWVIESPELVDAICGKLLGKELWLHKPVDIRAKSGVTEDNWHRRGEVDVPLQQQWFIRTASYQSARYNSIEELVSGEKLKLEWGTLGVDAYFPDGVLVPCIVSEYARKDQL